MGLVLRLSWLRRAGERACPARHTETLCLETKAGSVPDRIHRASLARWTKRCSSSDASPLGVCSLSLGAWVPRNTDLFARMAKAASLTAASMAQEGQPSSSDTSVNASSRAAGSGVSTVDGTNTRGLQEMDRRRRGVNGSGGEPKRHSGAGVRGGVGEQGPDTSGSTESLAEVTEPAARGNMEAGGVGSEGMEREGRKRLPGEAVSEFERLAQELQAQARKADRSDVAGSRVAASGGVVAAGNGRAKGPSNPMEVDSDEEEPITLVGEFQVAATATDAAASGRDFAANVSVERDQDDGASESVDDDLASAMKPGKLKGKGKLRVRGKGRRAKDKNKQRA